jgi:hypothetical protein
LIRSSDGGDILLEQVLGPSMRLNNWTLNTTLQDELGCR